MEEVQLLGGGFRHLLCAPSESLHFPPEELTLRNQHFCASLLAKVNHFFQDLARGADIIRKTHMAVLHVECLFWQGAALISC